MWTRIVFDIAVAFMMCLPLVKVMIVYIRILHVSFQGLNFKESFD